jgi:hypothetical protein
MPKFHLPKGRYAAPWESRYSRYIKKSAIERTDSLAVDAHDQLLPETHGSYGALLLHPNWKAKRKEILERDNHKCRVCNSSEELEVHHRQYLFIRATKQFKPPWDYAGHLLITLCSKCHARGHAQYKVPSILI